MYNDFLSCAKTFFPIGDYITINISSPNTEGLRNFHEKENLEKLLIKINEIRKESNFKKSFLLKISPDLDESSVNNIVDLVNFRDPDGVINSFLFNFRDEFLATLPENLESGVDKRKLIKILNHFIGQKVQFVAMKCFLEYYLVKHLKQFILENKCLKHPMVNLIH